MSGEPEMTLVDKEIRALATVLLERVDELAKEMATRIRAGSREYHYDAVPEEDLEEACRIHVGNALQALSGQAPLDTGTAAEIGHRRARQNVPLPTVMTAYRVGVKYFWEVVVDEATTTALVGNDVLVATASAMWEIQDGITEGMVSGYHDEVARRLLAGDQERSALVEALLEGRSMDADAVWSAAEVLRVPRDGPFTVVAAEVPGIGRRALPDIAALLTRRGIRSAWRLRPDLQLGIVHLRTPRDLDDLVEVLRDHAERRVGVSPSYDDLNRTGDALRFAKVAMRGGDAQSSAVTVFDDSPVAVATAGAPDVMARVAAKVLGPVEALPEDERALLLDTLDVWFDCGGSAEEAAKQLYVHPNTVRTRLRRITEHTGRSLTDPRGITELALALRAVRQTPRLPAPESTDGP
ncbi:PucR family transcriptional regulator [Streptomyces xylophagus]|uniref:PucR family transcriptional regulator n=1 Tax=Streptomyces xylophagus TaxID=285514 RepID=UPI001F3E1637|nr:helix-turn-helix domain-containing protein [Streptomyces xylophagus]